MDSDHTIPSTTAPETRGRLRNVLRALVVAGFGVGFFFFLVWFRWNSATLPDGTRVKLIGAAVGNTTFTTETWLERTLRHYLPPQLTRWIPATFSATVGDTTNCVVVYLRGRTIQPVGLHPHPWNSFVSEDDSGIRWTMNLPSWTVGMDGSNSFTAGLFLSAFPRRQKYFLVHLLDEKRNSLATFRVRNPKSGPFPVWSAAHLPLTESNGAISLTLKSLKRRVTPSGVELKPEWNITSSRYNLENVTPDHFKFFDPTGNEGDQPPPHEPVWKMQVRVHRELLRDFVPSEIMTFTNIPVPGATNFVAIDRTQESSGLNIKMHLIAPAGELSIADDDSRKFSPVIRNPEGAGSTGGPTAAGWRSVSRWVCRAPFLLFDADGLKFDDELWLRVIDDQGRQVLLSNLGTWFPGRPRNYYPKLPIPDDAKNLCVTLWVSHPYIFSFLVNESDVLDEPSGQTR